VLQHLLISLHTLLHHLFLYRLPLIQLIRRHHIKGSGNHSLCCAGYWKWLAWLLVCWPWFLVVKRLISRGWNFFDGVALPKRKLRFKYLASHWLEIVGLRTEPTFLFSHFICFPGDRLHGWVLNRVGLFSVHISFVNTALIRIESILPLSFFLHLLYQVLPLLLHDSLFVTPTVVIVCEARQEPCFLHKLWCWVRSADQVNRRQHWLSFCIPVGWIDNLVANLSLLSLVLPHSLL